MTKSIGKKIIKTIVLSIIITFIIGGAIAFLITTIDQDVIKQKTIQLVHNKTGRELKINGDVNWTFFPWLGIKVQNVSLSNPPDFKSPYLAEAKEVGINIKLLSLIFGHIEIGNLTFKNLNLQLIKNSFGKSNWQDLLMPDSTKKSSNVSKNNHLNLAKFTIGNIAIDNGSVFWQDQKINKKIKINRFNLHCKNGAISDNKTINCQKIGFDFYQGQASGSANIDLQNLTPRLNLKLVLENTSMQLLLTDIAKYEKFSGALTLNANIDINNLNGDGKILISHGSYHGIDIPYEIRRVHALINVKPMPEKSYPPHTDFDQLTMSFKVNNGSLSTSDFLIQAPDYKATGQGGANLLSKHLNLSLNAYSTHDESFFVPIKITGAFTDPSIRFDTATLIQHTVKKVIKDVIQDQVGKRLQNLPQDLTKILPLDKLFH